MRRAELGLLGTYRHWHVIARDTMTLRSGGCANGRGRGRTGTSSPPGAHPPSSLGASTAEESAFKRGVAGMARERPRDGHQGKAFWREVRSSVSTLTNAKNAQSDRTSSSHWPKLTEPVPAFGGRRTRLVSTKLLHPRHLAPRSRPHATETTPPIIMRVACAHVANGHDADHPLRRQRGDLDSARRACASLGARPDDEPRRSPA